ncbi:hypothetical protein LZ31DRAFT_477658, partial [Colletotrichum somersetense]
ITPLSISLVSYYITLFPIVTYFYLTVTFTAIFTRKKGLFSYLSSCFPNLRNFFLAIYINSASKAATIYTTLS